MYLIYIYIYIYTHIYIYVSIIIYTDSGFVQEKVTERQMLSRKHIYLILSPLNLTLCSRSGSCPDPSCRDTDGAKYAFLQRTGRCLMQSYWSINWFVWKCCVPHCTQWFGWSLSLLNGYHWGYTPFSDIPILAFKARNIVEICRNQIYFAAATDLRIQISLWIRCRWLIRPRTFIRCWIFRILIRLDSWSFGTFCRSLKVQFTVTQLVQESYLLDCLTLSGAKAIKDREPTEPG